MNIFIDGNVKDWHTDCSLWLRPDSPAEELEFDERNIRDTAK